MGHKEVAPAAGRGVPAWAVPTLPALTSAPGGRGGTGWAGLAPSSGLFSSWAASLGCDVMSNSLSRTQGGDPRGWLDPGVPRGKEEQWAEAGELCSTEGPMR